MLETPCKKPALTRRSGVQRYLFFTHTHTHGHPVKMIRQFRIFLNKYNTLRVEHFSSTYRPGFFLRHLITEKRRVLISGNAVHHPKSPLPSTKRVSKEREIKHTQEIKLRRKKEGRRKEGKRKEDTTKKDLKRKIRTSLWQLYQYYRWYRRIDETYINRG